MSFSKKTHSFASLFLLLVFTTVQLLQAVHVHLDIKHNKTAISQPGKICKKSFSKQVSKCLICDYFHHQQDSKVPGLIHFSFTCYAVKPLLFNTGYAQNIIESSVHTWTNKGPPTVSI
ncbi:MAG: hypothetical protein EOP43_07530 [Sphingobacteriaceae bacterium]|nr:MAG: hypothetical protein EOP43_07530 [Sphingobacteriaceae bacterium]